MRSINRTRKIISLFIIISIIVISLVTVAYSNTAGILSNAQKSIWNQGVTIIVHYIKKDGIRTIKLQNIYGLIDLLFKHSDGKYVALINGTKYVYIYKSVDHMRKNVEIRVYYKNKLLKQSNFLIIRKTPEEYQIIVNNCSCGCCNKIITIKKNDNNKVVDPDVYYTFYVDSKGTGSGTHTECWWTWKSSAWVIDGKLTVTWDGPVIATFEVLGCIIPLMFQNGSVTISDSQGFYKNYLMSPFVIPGSNNEVKGPTGNVTIEYSHQNVAITIDIEWYYYAIIV